MNRTFPIIALALSVAGSVGCASKNYVKEQTTPLINKVNELDDLTAQNTKEIKEVDQRAQAGIQQADATATAADQKAQAASQTATQAQTQANTATQRIDTLQTVVANLDNYHVVNEASVRFGTSRSNLSKNARAQLDQLAANAPNVKNYIFVIQGYTDSVGSKSYNYALSDRRADTVVRYLAVNHEIPPFKIYVVGLGEHKPVGSNKTASGRAKNRRADVLLMTNAVEGATTAANQPPDEQ